MMPPPTRAQMESMDRMSTTMPAFTRKRPKKSWPPERIAMGMDFEVQNLNSRKTSSSFLSNYGQGFFGEDVEEYSELMEVGA